MATPKREVVASGLPIRRGLTDIEACVYVGCTLSKFRELVKSKTMPEPRLIGSRRLWDIRELDLCYDNLPRENENEADSWADYLNGGDQAKAC